MAGIPTDILALRQLHQAPPAPRSPAPRSPAQPRSRRASPPAPSTGPGALEAALTRGYPAAKSSAERFGEWLVRRRCICRCELFSALDVAFRHGCRLGDALVWLDLLQRQTVEREARFFQRVACSAATTVVPRTG